MPPPRLTILPPIRDSLLLALGILPALLLGITWMRHAHIPPAVYLQNVAAVVVGAAIAAYGVRRRASTAVIAIAIVLLLATLVTAGVEGVHRWIRISPFSFHVASLFLPVVLVALDRMLRGARAGVAMFLMLAIAAILAIQPDAGQATAFAGAAIALLVIHWKPNRAAFVFALLVLAALSFVRRDPLEPVPHVEEIAVRIAQQGAVWTVAVVIALALLIVPFIAHKTTASFAVAVYLVLTIASSYWGHFPVPVLGFGMSPIIGYLAGWGTAGASHEFASNPRSVRPRTRQTRKPCK